MTLVSESVHGNAVSLDASNSDGCLERVDSTQQPD